MEFSAVCISHVNVPQEIRGQFHLTENQCQSFHSQLKEVLGIQEALVISTCNRTEVYIHHDENNLNDVFKLLCLQKGLSSESFSGYVEWIESPIQCVKRLFEVCLGLHSRITGDLQISGQAKKAYSLSNECGMAGPFIHRLMHTIFHCNKRVQQETAWREGAASVSSACVELVLELADYHQNPSVLIVGMGEMGREICLNLKNNPTLKLSICNRTEQKAIRLAEECNAALISYSELGNRCSEFDIIVVSISTQVPVLKASDFLKKPIHQNQFIIDVSLPAAIEKEVDFLPGIQLYTLDDISIKNTEAAEKRRLALPKVEEILGEEVARFLFWDKETEISPAIQKLKHALEQIRREELERFLKRASPSEASLAEKVTESMINKILRLPVVNLKNACLRGEQENLMEALIDLFDLEKEKKKKSSF